MKKYIFTGFFLALTIIINGQNYNVTWQQCYGGIGDNSNSNVVEKTNDGFLFGTKVFSDELGTNYHGKGDICVIKTDTAKNSIWAKCYGGSDDEIIRKIINIDNSNYYLFGSSYSTDGDIQSGNNGFNDIWVVKINSSGEILWEKTYGCSGIDDGRDMVITPDGGFVFINRIGSKGGDVSQFYGFGDVWICKCDSEGNIEWEKTIGNDGLDNGNALLINRKGNIMMLGATQWHGGMVTCYPLGFYGNMWLVELDMQGTIVWQSCYGGSVYEVGIDFIETDNGYLFIASSHSNDGDVSGHHGTPGPPPEGKDDYWVVSIDTVGEIIWQKSLGGSSYDTPMTLDIGENDDIVVFGYSVSQDGDVIGNHSYPGHKDLWMVKLDKYGTLIEQQCFGGTWDEDFNKYAVAKINDHHYVVASGAVKNDGDINCNLTGNGDRDAWFFEIKDCSYYAPSIPTVPNGPTYVCSSSTNQSIYTTQPAQNAQDYIWELLPASSGTIEPVANNATVTWNPGYKCVATIKVLSSSDCGNSAWSDSLLAQIETCVGVNEFLLTGFKAYPNPANGYVIFESPTISTGLISITDIFGRLVAEVSVKELKTVWDTKGIKPGVYLYHLNNGMQMTSGKIMITN